MFLNRALLAVTLTAFLSLLTSCSGTSKKADTATPGTTETQTPRVELAAGQKPKIGVILGPGGLKTFSYIGVLREFEEARIPIHAITGLEWGSLVAALYSVKGKVNDLEWQMMKLDKNHLPDSSLLSQSYDSASSKKLYTYLNRVFGSKKIDSSTITFSCPALYTGNGKVAWVDRGTYRDGLRKCVSYPPLYNSDKGWVAAAFELEQAAQRLRDQGAEVIIFVNALARGTVLKDGRVRDLTLNQLLWWEGLQRMNAASSKSVDWVVGVHTRNYDLLDFDARQSFLLFGKEFGAVAARKIANQYGF